METDMLSVYDPKTFERATGRVRDDFNTAGPSDDDDDEWFEDDPEDTPVVGDEPGGDEEGLTAHGPWMTQRQWDDRDMLAALPGAVAEGTAVWVPMAHVPEAWGSLTCSADAFRTVFVPGIRFDLDVPQGEGP